MARLRNEDLSVYFFVKDIVVGSSTIGSLIPNIVDSYPYNEIENETLKVPCIAVEHRTTSDVNVGELGASWFRRSWEITLFATTDTQRDDLGDVIFRALDKAIPIKDYSSGFRKDNGKSLANTDLRVIEYANVENRFMRPAYNFGQYQKLKYWRLTVSFDTVSTQAS
jgi:hypothetical protein